MYQRDDKERWFKKRDPPSEPISTDKTETPSQLWLAPPFVLRKEKKRKKKRRERPQKKKQKKKRSRSLFV